MKGVKYEKTLAKIQDRGIFVCEIFEETFNPNL